jgi:hypothetical protein
MRKPIARSFVAGLAYFAAVFAAGFVLGTVRVLLLAPVVGESLAVAVELPIMLSLSWVACKGIAKRFQVPSDLPSRAWMGGSAFGLLMVAEMGVSLFMFGRPFSAHLAHYREVPALLGLAGQIAFAAFPAIQA